MYWAILISLIMLGLAFLIRQLLAKFIEVRYTFFVIIGVFLVLYVGAAIFVSYNLKAINATNFSLGDADSGSAYAKVDVVHEVDLSTGP